MGLEIGGRQLLQMREEVVPHVVFDIAGRPDEKPSHQEPEHAADQADSQQQDAVLQQLCARDAPGQIVNGVLENLRRSEGHGLSHDGTREPERKRTPVSAHIAEEPAKGAHLLGEYNP